MLRCEGRPGSDGYTNVPCPFTHGTANTFLSMGDVVQCKDCEKIRFPQLHVGIQGDSTQNKLVVLPDASVNTTEEITDGTTRTDIVNDVVDDCITHTTDTNSGSTRNCPLQKLNGKTGVDFVNEYVSSIEHIHNFGRANIISTISSCNMETLSMLHNALKDTFTTQFPMYQGVKTVKRQTVRTTAPDIFTLGYCCVNKQVTKDAQRIFLGKPNECNAATDDVTVDSESVISQQDFADLIDTVAKLQIAINTLKSDNTAIRAELSLYQSRCENTDVPPIRDSAVTSRPDDGDEEDVNNSLIVISSDEESNDTNIVSEVENQFVIPRAQRRKSRRERRLEKENAALQAQVATPLTPTSIIKAAKPVSKTISARTVGLTVACTPGMKSARNNTRRDKRCDIYIGALDSDVSSENISLHITSLGVSEMRHSQVMTLSDSPNWKSVKVSIPCDKQRVVLDPRNWPEGVRLRPFREDSSGTTNKRSGGQISSSRGVKSGPRKSFKNTSWSKDTRAYNRHEGYTRSGDEYSRPDEGYTQNNSRSSPPYAWRDEYPEWSTPRSYDRHIPTSWY